MHCPPHYHAYAAMGTSGSSWKRPVELATPTSALLSDRLVAGLQSTRRDTARPYRGEPASRNAVGAPKDYNENRGRENEAAQALKYVAGPPRRPNRHHLSCESLKIC